MKRIIPFILIFALLTACGTPAAAPSSAPSAVPSETPQSTTAPTPALYEDLTLEHLPYEPDQPDYIPPMDFEPVSVWQAEAFGDNGRALLYIGEEENGITPFKMFVVNKFYLSGGDIPYARSLDCRSFSGSFKGDDGVYTFDAACYTGGDERYERYLLEAACIDGISGGMNMSGNALTMTYASASPCDGMTIKTDFDAGAPNVECTRGEYGSNPRRLYLPVGFIRLPEDRLGKAMYQMPAFSEELEPDGLRGLGIGDSMIDALFRIPRYDEYTCWDQLPSDILPIYGAGAMNWFGAYINMEEDGGLNLAVQAFDSITYTLDKNFKIESVEYYEQNFW